MRQVTMTILGLLAVLAARSSVAAETAPCKTPQSRLLVGLWESENRSRGGIGHALEFRADGSVVESPTVLVDSYYRVFGDQVIIGETPNPESGDRTTSWPLRIEGDRMVKERSGVSAERVGPPVPDQPELVGVWRSPFPAGGMAYERYTPEGRLYFRLPMRPVKGCYRFDGAKLTLAINGKQKSGVAEVRGDELTLKFRNRDADKYHRDSAGPFYPLAHAEPQPPN